jgi:hypothetical protein
MILTTVVAALGFASAESLTIFRPSEAQLRGAWEVGRRSRHEWGSSQMPGTFRNVIGNQPVAAKWLTPVSDAYDRGWKWTLKPENYPFEMLIKGSSQLNDRLVFEVSLSALPRVGINSLADADPSVIDKATCTLVIDNLRIAPSTKPTFVNKADSGEHNFSESELIQDGYWDIQGNYIEPKYQTTHRAEKYYFWKGTAHVEFTKSLPPNLSLEKLAAKDITLEIAFDKSVTRLTFRRRDREKVLKAISQVR